jgi:hypothetical protein
MIQPYLDDWLGWGAGCVRIRGNILQFSHTQLTEKTYRILLIQYSTSNRLKIFLLYAKFLQIYVFPARS